MGRGRIVVLTFPSVGWLYMQVRMHVHSYVRLVRTKSHLRTCGSLKAVVLHDVDISMASCLPEGAINIPATFLFEHGPCACV